ncbi:MAG: hypothetical protein FWG51_03055 [Firmicutes bacterium]|nr:hypothetical protein [Bacillota bacterium]
MSPKTIRRDAKVAEAIDIIGETSPEAKKMILSGEAKISKKDLEELSSKPKEELAEIAAGIEDGTYEKGGPEAPAAAEKNSLPPLDTMIDKIAGELLVDIPLTTLIQNRIKQSYNKSDNKTLWLVLVICGFPLWFPVFAAIAAIIFAVFVMFWAFAFSFVIMAAAFLLTGFAGVFYGIYICFVSGAAPGLFISGSCLALFGLALISIRPLLRLFKSFIKAIPGTFRQLKRLFVSKKEATV